MERGQAWVALVLGLLVAGLLVIVLGLGDAPRRVRDGDEVVWDLRLDAVDEVEVQGRWRLLRTPAGWTVDGAPADPAAVHEVLDALVEAHRGKAVEGDLSDFGLDQPLRVRVRHAGVEETLEVGEVAPVGERTWVRRPGGGVVAVYGGIGLAVRVSASAFLAAEGEAGEEPTR